MRGLRPAQRAAAWLHSVGVKEVTTMVEVIGYANSLKDEVIGLILSIQQDEFEFDVTVDDQPDLLNVSAFYQFGAGGFWVALDGEEVVGTIALRDIGNRQAALKKMYVKASHRGSRHATASRLLAQALRVAAAHDIQDVFLGTTDKFLAAHRFYEKSGFVQVMPEVLPSAFPRVPVDTRFYRLSLSK
jgi:GNAT superfamily N-acetyltransferase